MNANEREFCVRDFNSSKKEWKNNDFYTFGYWRSFASIRG